MSKRVYTFDSYVQTIPQLTRDAAQMIRQQIINRTKVEMTYNHDTMDYRLHFRFPILRIAEHEE